MDLGFIRDIFNKKSKDNEATRFLEELNKERIDQCERRISIKSRNTIRNNEEKIIEENKNKLSENEINQEIEKMKNEVLDKQDKQLEEFRKEDHLYMVEEDRNGKIFLTDITDESSNIVLEEVNFPEDLKNDATEGTVFKYKDGEYKFYSRDGFDRI